jgi:hypothetical protein
LVFRDTGEFGGLVRDRTLRNTNDALVIIRTAGGTWTELAWNGDSESGISTITLGAGATTFAVTKHVHTIDGDGGGNTIATITGGWTGMILTLRFVDASVTITDNDTEAANIISLSAAFTSSARDTMTLLFNGTSWQEISRSVN